MFGEVYQKITFRAHHIAHGHTIRIERFYHEIFRIADSNRLIRYDIRTFFFCACKIDRHRTVIVNDDIATTEIMSFISISFSVEYIPLAIQCFLLNIRAVFT